MDAIRIALEWKQKQAQFFLDTLEDYVSNIGLDKTVEEDPDRYIDSKPIAKNLFFISAYADAFIYSVISYFDILARYHTVNESNFRRMYFRTWLKYQEKRNEDEYIKFLRKEFDGWIEELIFIRNNFAHRCHPYIHMTPNVKVEKRNGLYELKLMPIKFSGEVF